VQYEGTSYELKVHSDPEIDLDYYAIELGRLVALTDEIDRQFGEPVEINSARVAFGCGSPEGAYLVGMTSPR
jgi:hypothetical protein